MRFKNKNKYKYKYKKHEGYILFIVIIITIILTSITITVTMLSTSHSNDTLKDIKAGKSYYISHAALEMVYAALNDNSVSGGNIIGRGGKGDFDQEKEKILEKTNFPIKNQSGDTLGFADIVVDLKKTSGKESRWYFRIVANGRINLKPGETNTVKDQHILTMVVFSDDPNNPKIYNGNKANV